MRQQNIDAKKVPASIYVCTESPFLGRVKIGRTSQTAVRRQQSIQVGNPNTIVMLHMTKPIKHHKVYERALHKAYKDKHIRGEWFQLEQWEVDDLINNLMEDEDILTDGDNYDIANVLKHTSVYGSHDNAIDEPVLEEIIEPTEFKMIKSPKGKQRVILRYKQYDTIYVHKRMRKGYCLSLNPTPRYTLNDDELIEVKGTRWFRTLKELKLAVL